MTQGNLDVLMTDWLTDLANGGKSDRTVEVYSYGVRAYLAHQGTAVADLTRPAIRAWMRSMSQQAVTTQQSKFAGLASFCKWLVAEDVLTDNPIAGLPRPKPKAEPVNPYTEDEKKRLLEACGRSGFLARRDTAILTTLMTTGMRLSEVTGMTLSSIDQKKRAILVLGKGKKWREIPYGDELVPALGYYLRTRKAHRFADSDKLWLGKQGPLTQWGVDRMLRKLADQAGVEGVHAHRFRHTAAIYYLEHGISESTVMMIFGWSNVSMLQRYIAAKRKELAHAEFHKTFG